MHANYVYTLALCVRVRVSSSRVHTKIHLFVYQIKYYPHSICFYFGLVWFSFQHTHCDGSHSLSEQNRDRYMEITMARARESEGWREGL